MTKDPSFSAIEQIINKRSMLYFTGHKRQVLKCRLEQRCTLLGLPDLAAYLDLLSRSPGEESALMDLITTNETFFFRNGPQFDFLMKKIMPELEKEKGKRVITSWGSTEVIPSASIMKIRILCAGCSTGEEPYSIAMALLESLHYPKAWDIEIVAGDLSDKCIRQAEKGFYEDERLKGLPDTFVGKYMEKVAGGAMVSDEVKRLVRFCRLNLIEVINDKVSVFGSNGAMFDLIFCRNVMIYFSLNTQQRLVNAFYDLLVPGGFFFTGDAEALHIYDHGFQAVHDAECLIYTKVETERHGKTS